MGKKPLMELMVTMWPSFPFFDLFANDLRLSGVRLNSAMMSNPELDVELQRIKTAKPILPLFFDIKGRQMRIARINYNPKYLDITLNHAISVTTPTPVLFKAGADHALLARLEEGGKRLIFDGGPYYNVRPGESIHIRSSDLLVHEPLFTAEEIVKIEKVVAAGFRNYFLSYVESARDVDQFLELVGRDSMVYLKIESRQGLEYVARQFRKRPNLVLVAARGDLYVEIDKPHDIMAALKLIIEKDPEAQVGSRMLLSIVQEPVPSAADLLELAWLYDIGYRRAMLCDELCLKEDLLRTAVDAFDNFRMSYTNLVQSKRKWYESLLNC